MGNPSLTDGRLACRAMGDFFRFGRLARRQVGIGSQHGGRVGNARGLRKARSFISTGLSRHFGFIAIAALAAAGLLKWGIAPARLGVGPLVTAWNARAIDGDSLRVGGQEIRLLGIDAPELFQTCRDASGREWACGREAHRQLHALISRGRLNCVSRAKDRYGRVLATCSAGQVVDLGEAMVRAGFAVIFMSGQYQAAEARARAEKRGIWQGYFERPQRYRRRNDGTG